MIFEPWNGKASKIAVIAKPLHMGVIYRGCGHLKQKICWYIFCILSYKLFRAISGLGIFEQMLGQNTKFCPQQIVSDDCPDFFTSINFCRISCPSWHHIAGFTLESIIFKLRAVSVWKNRIVIFCSKWSPLWRRQISRSGQGVKFHMLTELCNLEQPSCYLRHGEATNMGGLGGSSKYEGGWATNMARVSSLMCWMKFSVLPPGALSYLLPIGSHPPTQRGITSDQLPIAILGKS